MDPDSFLLYNSDYEHKALDEYSKTALDREFFVDVLWLLQEDRGDVRCLVSVISAPPWPQPSVQTARSRTEH